MVACCSAFFVFYLFLLGFPLSVYADDGSCSRNGAALGNLDETSDRPPSFAPYLSIPDTSDSEILYERGHLKPLGYHRSPDRIVESLPFMIAPQDFHEQFVSKHRPVVIKGYVKHWPATKLWTDEYLTAEYGHMKMMMETKDDDKYRPPPSRPFKDFLDNYQTSNLYLVDETLPAMRRDITLPSCLRCEEMTDRLFLSSFWMSNGGTSSKVHVDTNENLLCVIQGSKTLLLVSPLQSQELYADDSHILGVSAIDPTQVDFDKYPRMKDLHYELAFVDAGDLVYIPQFWWHHVISHSGRQQAVSLWWKSYPLGKPAGFPIGNPVSGEHGLYSYVDALVYHEQWVLNMSETMSRLQCRSQAVPMSDFMWETDRIKGAETTKEYGYDEESTWGKAFEKYMREEEEEEDFVKFCAFNASNDQSPCFLNECSHFGEDNLVCLRYILDYCHEVEDKGCATQLPQLLTKKTQSEIAELQRLEKQWGQQNQDKKT